MPTCFWNLNKPRWIFCFEWCKAARLDFAGTREKICTQEVHEYFCVKKRIFVLGSHEYLYKRRAVEWQSNSMAPLTMLLIDQKNSHSTYSCSSIQLYGNLCFLYTCICVNIVLELLTVIHFWYGVCVNMWVRSINYLWEFWSRIEGGFE